MRGSLKAAPVVLSGFVLGLGMAYCAPASAQQGQGQGQGQANVDRDQKEARRGDEGSAGLDRVLESYQSYRQKAGKNIDQVREEIERSVKELSELTSMRYKMAVALAGHRVAQQRQGQMIGYAGGPSPGTSQQANRRSEDRDDEGDIQTREALARELEQVQAQLRSEIEQARNQADQLASQIRALREQQRNQSRDADDRRGRDQNRGKQGQPVQSGQQPGQGQNPPGNVNNQNQGQANQGQPNQPRQDQPNRNQGDQDRQNRSGQASSNQQGLGDSTDYNEQARRQRRDLPADYSPNRKESNERGEKDK
jgi:hypothetical protein